MGGYEVEICGDSNCNTVINSGSYADVSWTWAIDLSDGTYYWRVKARDRLWNWWNWSETLSFVVDTTGPSVTLTTTNTEKSTNQRLTWTCEDAVWVTAYYLGTSASPVTGDYNTVASATSYTTWMNVTAAWTYYLYCKDVVGNISTWKSVTYYTYSVQNMLDKIEWSTWAYNTTNYDTAGSVMWTYIIPSGTTITLDNSTTYGDPIASHDTYKWYTTANSGNPTTSNPSISANTTYYRWFWRDTHTLTLNKWAWINSVTGAWTYKHGATVNISATANTTSGYVFSGWTVTTGNTPASMTNSRKN